MIAPVDFLARGPLAGVIDSIMDRGGLPVRVLVMRSGGGAVAGDVFIWCEAWRGYFCPDRPGIVAPAAFVRAAWGKVFSSVPAVAYQPEFVA